MIGGSGARGSGKINKQTVAATAGNATKNLSPGTGQRWKLLYGKLTLVNDATVANRYVEIVITDGTDVIGKLGGNSTAYTAGQTNDVIINSNTSSRQLAEGVYLNEFPILEGSDQLRITVTGGQAGDSFSGFIVFLETPAGI